MKIADISTFSLEELDRERLEKTLRHELTVVTRAGEPAAEVAVRFDEARGGLVVVVSGAGEPVAVLDPELFLKQLKRYKGIRARTLTLGVEELLKDPEERRRSYEHEWLNRIRPRPHWCAPGQHYTSRNPCPVHE